MTLLLPIGLVLGLVLPALILLYLLKVRRRETEVSSTYIWRQLVRDVAAHEPFQKLRLSPLLVVQLLLLTALVLAFARPALPVLAQESVTAVVVVDASASMQATDVQPTRFEAARQQARQVLESLPEGSSTTVIEAGRRPRAVAADQSDPRTSIRALDDLRPSFASADMVEALRLGVALAGDKPRRHVYLISDGAFGDLETPDLHGAALTFVPVGGGVDNRAVTTIAARPDAVDHSQVHLFVRVRNYADTPVAETLTLIADGSPVEARPVLLPANGGVDLVLDSLPRGARLVQAKLAGSDALGADDSAAVVLGNRPPAKALLVSSGNLFLERLLRIIPGIELYRIDPQRYFALDTDLFDVVIFDNVLPDLLPRGNVLAINPPNNPLFPVQGEVTRPAITYWDKEHPLLRFVDLREVGIARASNLAAPGWARPLVEAKDVPLLFAGDDGGRRVVVFPFDLRQSNLPLSVAFPILMSNVLGYLEPTGTFDVKSLSPNQAQSLIPLPQADAVLVTRPDGSTSTLEPDHGQPLLFDATDEVGLYDVSQRQGDQTLASEQFAVNLADEAESDIRPGGGPAGAAPQSGADTPLATVQREIWIPLALLAAALLLGEWWLYHHGEGNRVPLLPAVELTRPLALLALAAAIPVLLLINRRSRAYLPAGRRNVALGMRLAVTTLLILAVAAPTLRGPADRMAIAFLVDRSDSISPQSRADQETWLRQALAGMSAEDRASVVVFGAEPLMERQLSSDHTLQTIGSVPPPGRTDLAAAIRLGMASLPSTWARKLVVLSDGNQNLGSAEEEAALVRAAGVPISVVPVASASGSEVLVRDVQAPSVLREGEAYSASVSVESTGSTHARLHLLSDGQVVGEQEVDLAPGTNSIVFAQTPLDKGFHSLQVQLEAQDDTFAENNQGGAFVVVRGRPNVLVVEDQTGQGHFLANGLRASGIGVDVLSVGSAPLTQSALRSYDSLVLVNVPANKLSEDQMRAIQSYVRDFGGGLVAIGGQQSFTVGSYSRTPLEETLPVRMELQGRTASASVALVLVIDSSGSMAGGPFGASKMDLAKEAAASAAELLGEYDRLGIIAFEETPRWVVDVQDQIDLARVQQEISSMSPGGGTNVYPAVDEAYRALATLDAKVKHVILLSDGITPGADWDGLTFRFNQANITLSTIAIGSDADAALMKQLAVDGKGRYYEGNDPFDLPRLVIKETQQVARAAIVEEPFTPLPNGNSPVLEGFQNTRFPILRGYVSTTLKPATQVDMTTAQGDPLLSEWQYGLGRAAAWTSDAENKWAADWVDWSEFSRFWAQVVKRTLPNPVDPNRQISVNQEGAEAHVVVDATDEQRAFLNFAHATANVTAPDGTSLEVPLAQTAPGRYEGRFPARSEGSYFVEVVQRDDAGNVVASQPGGYVVPYSAEYRERQADTRLLAEIARVTGGAMLAAPSTAFVHDQRAPGQPLDTWPWLLALATLLFLLDVAVRRLRLSWADMRPFFLRARHTWDDHVPVNAVVGSLARRSRRGAPDAAAAAPGFSSTLVSAAAPAPVNPAGRLLAAKRRARPPRVSAPEEEGDPRLS